MQLKLPSNIATVHDIDAVVLELKHYAKWYAQTTIQNQGGVEPATAPPVSDEARTLMGQIETEGDVTNKDFDQLIDALVDIKFDAKQLTITLAALPTSGVKAKLTEWCRSNIAADMLVNFTYDRRLLGGMIVRCGSHIFDWSFKRQIVEQADAFPKVLRNV